MSNHPLQCALCGRTVHGSELIPAEMIRGPIRELVERDSGPLAAGAVVCRRCVNRFRAEYVEDALEREHGELSRLEQEVVASLREHELLSRNVNVEVDRRLTLGERLADRLASFGGSWTFISIFALTLVVWMVVNAVMLGRRAFDPYPFILLNLVLSCLAAIQAPVIMMSQRRQESRDRLRAENDYRVNLKAELEIRNLHSKIDQLLSHQWQRLLEIQRIQTDLLEEISDGRDGRPRRPRGG
jgi:uncharacterized membrane protein